MAGCLMVSAILLSACDGGAEAKKRVVKVGVLHSKSGTMADSEKPVVDATLMAIDEINEKGIIPGVHVEAVIEDGASDPATFARKAEKLIREDGVVAIFGCWTSASRKAVKPIVEKYNSLLFYPVQYEGVEQSPNIVYLGAAPNQQIIPAVYWAMEDMGHDAFFLVGSDYVFPRTAHAIIKDQLYALGGEVAGEAYIPIGSDAVDDAIDQIEATEPDMILNTLNGSSNRAFFRGLRERGIDPEEIPTLSFSIVEGELSTIGARMLVGDYAAWNYFHSVQTPENQEWIARFKERYGQDRKTSDPMEAAYIGVHLWAKAARAASHVDGDGFFGSTCEPDDVQEHIPSQSFTAPGGLVFIDPENQHLYKTVRIGRVEADGVFHIVWDSEVPVRPNPYPIFRSALDWDGFITELNQQWGGSWSAPQD